ncbi:MAG TPA: DUF4130 domain-containing protein [Patescibacteria group bacterium]|nr:DUF4130 domain-containing protein [Patescibacteria group bacterium]
MIVCSSKPLPVILAALLARISGKLPCLDNEIRRLGLFAQLKPRFADKEDLGNLLDQLQQQQNLDARWLYSENGRQLARLIAANLRYQVPDRGPVMFAALEEAFLHGPSYCLLGIGDASQLFIARSRAVCHEVHRMTGFIRFHPAPNNMLIARPKLFHDTGDWLIRQLARRYPQACLILLLENQVLRFENNVLSVMGDPTPFLPYLNNQAFDIAWETYYRAQYIESRRNDRQASRLIPKKYRTWLNEGSILNEIALKPQT